ncbi:hypothetical protein HHK36_008331 [Tetracentron sinense]|uniref:Uncharacterized protein n=1 Tax=Tetracentron sinense TaxID=13715 RepID=A0A835DJX7_TETSI|nr:hypothetical protein HHK36_008331 [Tetracentron sinense]
MSSSTIGHEEVRYLVRQLLRGFHGRSQNVDLRPTLFQLIFNIMMGLVAGKQCFKEEAVDVEIGQRGGEEDGEFEEEEGCFFAGFDRRRQTKSSSTTTEAEEKKTIIGALLSIHEAEPEYYYEDIIKGIILVSTKGLFGYKVHIILAKPNAFNFTSLTKRQKQKKGVERDSYSSTPP